MPDDDCKLDLHGDDLKRYLAVRATLCDEHGVLRVTPNNDNPRDTRPAIREIGVPDEVGTPDCGDGSCD